MQTQLDLTSKVREEIVGFVSGREQEDKAELATMVQFCSNAVSITPEQVLTIEFEHESVAKRCALLAERRTGIKLQLQPVAGRKSGKVSLKLDRQITEFLQAIGLLTRSGVKIVGLPQRVVSGSIQVAEAVWRAAFLVSGQLADPRKSATLEVATPGMETSLALIGCARRIGLHAKTKTTRGVDKVYLRDDDEIGALLARIGAQRTRVMWDIERVQRSPKLPANRLANFDDANARRSARAAANAAAKVQRALEILADEVPEHLAEAGLLRCEHVEASLEELGRLADPPLTKDAIAGRIRRLLDMADKRAKELGMPDTSVVEQQ